MKKIFFIILIVALILTGCMPVLTVFFGISKPKEVTTKKMKKSNKIRIDR